jgi:VWFA-related protein
MCVPRRRFLALTATAAARAQQTETPIFKTEVNVVNLFATARGPNGAFVRDLDREDFLLLENGRPQRIQYFSRETDLPLILGLLIDTSMSQERVLDAERGACFRFLDRVLRERQDHVFVMQFDMGVFLMQGLTSSRKHLDDALSLVATPTRAQRSLPTTRGTLLYDAVTKACRDELTTPRGRKAIILMTDGIDVGSQTPLEEAIAAAHRADTILYSILFTDPGFPTYGRDGRGPLRRMSLDTGGAFFEVTAKLRIAATFGHIEQELRNQYSIGFVSDDPVRFTGFRSLKLTAKRPGVTVHSRTRYWAAP